MAASNIASQRLSITAAALASYQTVAVAGAIATAADNAMGLTQDSVNDIVKFFEKNYQATSVAAWCSASLLRLRILSS